MAASSKPKVKLSKESKRGDKKAKKLKAELNRVLKISKGTFYFTNLGRFKKSDSGEVTLVLGKGKDKKEVLADWVRK